MKVIDIADELYRELDRPSMTSVPAIAFWLTSNIGQLNTLLNLNVTVTDDEQFLPELSLMEKDIFKQIYVVNYFMRLVASNSGAAAYDASVIEVTEGNRTVRTVNRNEIAKVFAQQKKDAMVTLEGLVDLYRRNNATPRQIVDGPTPFWPAQYPLITSSNYRDHFDLD